MLFLYLTFRNRKLGQGQNFDKIQLGYIPSIYRTSIKVCMIKEYHVIAWTIFFLEKRFIIGQGKHMVRLIKISYHKVNGKILKAKGV